MSTVVFFKHDGSEILAEESRRKPSKAMFLVKRLVKLALDARATDVHFEPEEDKTLVRYRVDGQLRDVASYDKDIGVSMISCIKVGADLDITQRMKFQDGGFRAQYGEKKFECRVSTVRDVFGDKLVLRLLHASPSLESIGLSDTDLPKLREFVNKQQGVLLISGPTGSGKTTTLYTILKKVDRAARNVMTVEDPIEYYLDHVTQVEIAEQRGITFGGALRSSLRQDTNVVMVGEIRDQETASTAMQLAFTGHLVLSSIHARSAAAIVYRLLDMGVEGYLLTSVLDVLMNQRLVRCLCPKCKAAVKPDKNIYEQLGAPLPRAGVIYEPFGCVECDGTGYKGRIGVFELVKMNPELQDAIMKKVPQSEFEKLISRDCTTLVEHGMEKVASGVTSLAEILHIVPSAQVRPDERPRE